MSSYVGGRMVAVVDLYLYLYGKTNNVGGSMVAGVDRTPNWFSQIHKFPHTPAATAAAAEHQNAKWPEDHREINSQSLEDTFCKITQVWDKYPLEKYTLDKF